MSRVKRYYPLLRRLAGWLPAAAAVLVLLATMVEAGPRGHETCAPGTGAGVTVAGWGV